MPSLQHLKKQSKNLVKIFPSLEQRRVPLQLSEAQEIVARLNGYPSWHAATSAAQIESPAPDAEVRSSDEMKQINDALAEKIASGECSLGTALWSLSISAQQFDQSVEVLYGEPRKTGAREFVDTMRQLAVVAYYYRLYGMVARLQTALPLADPDLAETAILLFNHANKLTFPLDAPVRDVFVGRLWGPMERSGIQRVSDLVEIIRTRGEYWRDAFSVGNLPGQLDAKWIFGTLKRRCGIAFSNEAQLMKRRKRSVPAPKARLMTA